jgi:hypothetical protein
MLWVGFELTVPASERAKTVHALDLAPAVIGKSVICSRLFHSKVPCRDDKWHQVYKSTENDSTVFRWIKYEPIWIEFTQIRPAEINSKVKAAP